MVYVIIITSDLYKNILNIDLKNTHESCRHFLEGNGFELIGELNDTWLYGNESRLEHAEVHKRNVN